LPIPALDGGHIVFILIEGIMKRPPRVKTRMLVQQIGMIFLLCLMVFIIFNDLTR
ncbi:MAG: RIP metalloprotease RseP, partial [Calditrichaeota bacterium]